MIRERWKSEELSKTMFYGYCLEDAPNGIQKPNMENFGRPTIKHMHFDGNGFNFVFSNCLGCSKKDFSGQYRTPANGKVPIEYKDPLGLDGVAVWCAQSATLKGSTGV
jgi:hypothetical protein